MRRVLVAGCVAALALAGVVVGSASPAFAPPLLPPCPTDVTTDTTLPGDCAAPLTITGNNVTMDLNGYSVTCDSPGLFGIRADGGGVRIENGTVTGEAQCVNGVVLAGGEGRVVGVTATGVGGAGFSLASSGDSVTRSTAHNNGGQGILVDGDQGRVVLNRVYDNATGILLSHGSRHAVVGNRATDNNDGISVRDGVTGNALLFNAASNNIDSDAVDENVNCDSNWWVWNRFGTRNQSCIH